MAEHPFELKDLKVINLEVTGNATGIGGDIGGNTIYVNTDNQTDATANNGGIVLRGDTDKSILWQSLDSSWYYNQSIVCESTLKVKSSTIGGDVNLYLENYYGTKATLRLVGSTYVQLAPSGGYLSFGIGAATHTIMDVNGLSSLYPIVANGTGISSIVKTDYLISKTTNNNLNISANGSGFVIIEDKCQIVSNVVRWGTNTAPTFTGADGIFLGLEAGYGVTTGENNICIGYSSGRNLGGDGNVSIGYNAGGSISGTLSLTAIRNVFVGRDSGINVTSGTYNTCVGFGSGRNIGSSTNNIIFGNSSGLGISNNLSVDNIAIGYLTAYGSGNYTRCCFIGKEAGKEADGAVDAICIGTNAGLYSGVTGSIFIGTSAGYLSGGGSHNIGIGYGAGYNSGGQYNVFMGYQAGDNLTSGSNVICIGKNARTSSATASNQCIIGGTLSEKVNVGIGGQNNPQYELDVLGSVRLTGDLIIDNAPTVSVQSSTYTIEGNTLPYQLSANVIGSIAHLKVKENLFVVGIMETIGASQYLKVALARIENKNLTFGTWYDVNNTTSPSSHISSIFGFDINQSTGSFFLVYNLGSFPNYRYHFMQYDESSMSITFGASDYISGTSNTPTFLEKISSNKAGVVWNSSTASKTAAIITITGTTPAITTSVATGDLISPNVKGIVKVWSSGNQMKALAFADVSGVKSTKTLLFDGDLDTITETTNTDVNPISTSDLIYSLEIVKYSETDNRYLVVYDDPTVNKLKAVAISYNNSTNTVTFGTPTGGFAPNRLWNYHYLINMSEHKSVFLSIANTSYYTIYTYSQGLNVYVDNVAYPVGITAKDRLAWNSPVNNDVFVSSFVSDVGGAVGPAYMLIKSIKERTLPLKSIGIDGDIYASGVVSAKKEFMVNDIAGTTGTFTSQDGKTITVTGGIVTGIV